MHASSQLRVAVTRCFKVIVAAVVLSCGVTARLCAADYLNLPVVKSLIPCGQLAKADLSAAVGSEVTIKSATLTDTPKGQFCSVTGNIYPSIIFEVHLPIDHWTQRFILNPSNFTAIGNAGSCEPAINGEFAVAFDNGGHSGGGLGDTTWTADPQLRIDFAYRANHVSALAAKALIKTFYGQPQKFAYFVGCSEGGRQALNEAQRFPEDFDGIAAGAPDAIDNVHNMFWHPWESFANRRADGTRVLVANRLGILHDAVMAHCANASGALDGVLWQPTACKFDRSWVECAAGSKDATQCLTPEEIGVVEKLYEGPGDGKGHRYEIGGFAIGSEHRWQLSTADHVANREAKEGFQMKRLLLPPESDKDTDTLEREFAFNQEWFDKSLTLGPLYNAANTNLGPFERHGGKLILWNGAEDLTIQPEISVAYYEGVQKLLGIKRTDSFMRFFMIPGFEHCAPGDIAFQLDVLTPLMAWTELKRAPTMIVVGKAAPVLDAVAPGRGAIAPGGTWQARSPLAVPNRAALFTRPIYPFPYFARYSGKGDPNDAASYRPEKSSAAVPQIFNTEAARLIGPDNQKFYRIENGQLVAGAK